MHPEELTILGLAVGASLLAIAVSLVAETFARRAQGIVMVASGVLLLGAVILHLGPEIIGHGLAGLVAIAIGALVGGSLELVSRSVSLSRNAVGAKAVARTALLALAVHSTIDGAVYAIPFAHDHNSGVAAGLGLVLHEAPEGAIALMLALQAGWSRLPAILVAALASSATTVVGWAAGAAIGGAAADHIEMLFAASAGLLAYSGVRLIMVGLRRSALKTENAG